LIISYQDFSFFKMKNLIFNNLFAFFKMQKGCARFF
jgi:hypothetical protein